MKTKEQILQEHVDKEQIDSLGENVWPDILEAMELYRNQPSGEGVKSAEEYLDANDPHGWLSDESSMRRVAVSALTAQAQDHRALLEEAVKLLDEARSRVWYWQAMYEKKHDDTVIGKIEQFLKANRL